MPRLPTAMVTRAGRAAPVPFVASRSATIDSLANDPHRPKKREAALNVGLCLGCGVCTRVCPTARLWLEARGRPHLD